jgi:hypothetical protein
MSNRPYAPGARTCGRCGRTTTPRAGRPPRYCATCGQALDVGSGQVRHRFGPPARVPGSAVAALALGFCAFIPFIGLPLGFFAIALRGSANQQIRRSGGQVGGGGIANLGVSLAVLGLVMQLMWYRVGC